MTSWLRALAPRDLRAFIALLASIGGTAVLTAVSVWIVWVLWRGGWLNGSENARIDKIGLIAILVIVIMGVTMTSLGLAINRRMVKGSAFGASFEAAGGEDDPAPAILMQVVNPPTDPVQVEARDDETAGGSPQRSEER